ncbi:MAG: hypothetical protein SFU56_20160 [Capsulimonadales bacterium]|nr:hypothetical protein [Capsulimonadales bacterium]
MNPPKNYSFLVFVAFIVLMGCIILGTLVARLSGKSEGPVMAGAVSQDRDGAIPPLEPPPVRIASTPDGKGASVPSPSGKGTEFDTAVALSSTEIARGVPVNVDVRVICRKGRLKDAIVDLEIYSPDGKKIHQDFTNLPALSKGEKENVNFVWVPTRPGKYSIRTGIFDSAWTNKHWNPTAASVTVTGPVGAKVSENESLTLPSPDAVVFADDVASGWRTEGWADEINPSDTFYQEGKQSLSVKSNGPFKGIQFTSVTFEPAPYDRLVFYLHGGLLGGQRLRASGKVNIDGNFEGRKGVFLAPLAAKRWQPVVIPLKMLGYEDARRGVSFFVMDNQAKPFQIWMDNVYFLKPGEKAPSRSLPIRQMSYGTGQESTVLDNQPKPLVDPGG